MPVATRISRPFFLAPWTLTASIHTGPGPIDDASSSPTQSPATPSSSPSETEAEAARARAEKLQTAETVIKYEFENKELLWEALQAAGSDMHELSGHSQGNKRLASLGDSLIALVVKRDGYLKKYTTGQTATLVGKVASNYRLATLCDTAGLTVCVNINPAQGGEISPRTRADTMEAVVGAVYLDGGLSKATSAMITLGIVDATYT
ncbi:ribonuclease III domain-containing protein [Xylaria sp. CBS 124048]|nr:ribonuclease III domain-containing protein [Xylaria sp. CBS 124048]